jgi:hypothetical protein
MNYYIECDPTPLANLLKYIDREKDRLIPSKTGIAFQIISVDPVKVEIAETESCPKCNNPKYKDKECYFCKYENNPKN